MTHARHEPGARLRRLVLLAGAVGLATFTGCRAGGLDQAGPASRNPASTTGRVHPDAAAATGSSGNSGSFGSVGSVVTGDPSAADPSGSLTGPLAVRPAGEGILSQIGGTVGDLDVQGDTLLLAVGPRVLAYDLTDPLRPHLYYSSDVLDDVVTDVALVNGHALATHSGGDGDSTALQTGGFIVLELPERGAVGGGDGSNSGSSLNGVGATQAEGAGLVARYETGGDTWAIEVQSATAYLADGLSGLVIVDVADPTAPRGISRLDLGVRATDVQVQAGTAYVASRKDGVFLVDVSDPAAPRALGSLDHDGSLQGIGVLEDTIYLATDYGLIAVDGSTPGRLQKRNLHLPAPGAATGGADDSDESPLELGDLKDFEVVDGMAFVAGESLYAVDLTGASPTGSIGTAATVSGDGTADKGSIGGTAATVSIVGQVSEVQGSTVDAAPTDGSPGESGAATPRFPLTPPAGSPSPGKLAHHASGALYSATGGGLSVYDARDPARVVLVSHEPHWPQLDYATHATALSTELLAVGEFVVDISEPSAPDVLGTSNLLEWVEPAMMGWQLLLPTGFDRLSRSPANAPRGSSDADRARTTSTVIGIMEVSEDPVGFNSLAVLSVDVPALAAYQVATSGSIAVIGGGQAGYGCPVLAVANVSDPLRPVMLAHTDQLSANIVSVGLASSAGSEDTPNGDTVSQPIVVLGDNCHCDTCLAEAPGTLDIFLRRGAPGRQSGQGLDRLTSLTLKGESMDMALLGSQAFVLTWPGGLSVYDLSDPERPAIVTEVPEVDGAEVLHLSGHTVYVGGPNPEGSGGLVTTLDFADIDRPAMRVSTRLPSRPTALTTVNDVLWVATENAGLIGLRIDDR